jgi:mannose-1-phosphate guanylyltransferase
VLPADHVIKKVEALRTAVVTGKSFALVGNLITFGIDPTSPETGYGYIKRGNSGEGKGKETAAYAVELFEEKPDLDTAKSYVE